MERCKLLLFFEPDMSVTTGSLKIIPVCQSPESSEFIYLTFVIWMSQQSPLQWINLMFYQMSREFSALWTVL